MKNFHFIDEETSTDDVWIILFQRPRRKAKAVLSRQFFENTLLTHLRKTFFDLFTTTMKPTTTASASNHIQSEIMTNPTSQSSEALRNALYKGLQGGTSGAMAMAIQVLQVNFFIHLLLLAKSLGEEGI